MKRIIRNFTRLYAVVFLFMAGATAAWAQADAGGDGTGAGTVAVDTDGDAIQKLRQFVGNIERFNMLFPQEKAYLHFDNTAYFRGETIWFSAYVARADAHSPTDMSQVLYVELLDPTGEVVERRKVRLDGGRGSGSIRLDKLLTAGYYEVRAYTRYMLNWDPSWSFSRVFPVFEAPKTDGDYGNLSIPEPVYRKRLPSSRSGATSSGSLSVRFYPEGGRLVRGLPSRVAFDVLDADGSPLDASGTLSLSGGVSVPVATVREGRGVFDYTPGPEPATLTVVGSNGSSRVFSLPDADSSSCVMSVDAVSGDRVSVSVSRSEGFASPLALVLVSGGSVVAADIISSDEPHAVRLFGRGDMPVGVSQFALVTPDGSIAAERMVFIAPGVPSDTIGIVADGALSPYGRLTLRASAEPGATFSVSVRDKSSDVNGGSGDAATWLLLSSDIRGFVSDPDYYFEADDAEHRLAADLLMLVQGWRRYDIAQMDGSKSFARSHPIEDGLYLYGQLRTTRRGRVAGGVSLTATLYNAAGESMRGTATTDSAGAYVFGLPDCEGEWTLLLNTRDQSGKASGYRVGIDRNFTPSARFLSPLETAPQTGIVGASLSVAESDVPDSVMARLSMDERVHMVREVEVKGKRLFENARAAWEDESRGASKSYVRYDCDRAADEIYDRGEDTPTIFEWLARKNSFFGGSEIDNNDDSYAATEIDTDSDESAATDGSEWANPLQPGAPSDELQSDVDHMTDGITYRNFVTRDGMGYKNRPIVWILNNFFYYATNARSVTSSDIEYVRDNSSEEMPRWLDEFKSVYISEDENVWRTYVSIPKLASYSPVTIFLYSHHTFPAKQKGLRTTHFDGYSRVETFQSPDYSLMPPMADYRRTLYWNPGVTTDANGEAVIEFYNNSTCNQIVVSAEGFTADGRPVVYR